MKASYQVNYEIVVKLPPGKRWRYLFRRDAFFRYELPAFAVIIAVLAIAPRLFRLAPNTAPPYRQQWRSEMCSQLPNCVCDAEDPRPPVEYLTERKRAVYDKLAQEGGGTWAIYMMMDIEEAFGAPAPSLLE